MKIYLYKISTRSFKCSCGVWHNLELYRLTAYLIGNQLSDISVEKLDCANEVYNITPNSNWTFEDYLNDGWSFKNCEAQTLWTTHN